jgi:hypothetical protein
VALAAAVASVGEGEGEVEGLADDFADGLADDFADGLADADDDGERAGVDEGDGVADGVAVGPSAIAGVAKNDTTKAAAKSGGARKRCTCTCSAKRVPHQPQRADTRLPSKRASPL